jgi:hypothetical protein
MYILPGKLTAGGIVPKPRSVQLFGSEFILKTPLCRMQTKFPDRARFRDFAASDIGSRAENLQTDRADGMSPSQRFRDLTAVWIVRRAENGLWILEARSASKGRMSHG